MSKLNASIIAAAIGFLAAVVFLVPSYLPSPRSITFETARAVFQPDTESIEPRLREALAQWGFVEAISQPTMRSQPEFYSCLGPVPTDDATLVGIFCKDEDKQRVFAELRIAEVEKGHSYVGIDFHTLPGSTAYTNRHHRNAANRLVAGYEALAESWFQQLGAAPEEAALSLQYSPTRERGTAYILVPGDFLKTHEQSLPEWFTPASMPVAVNSD